MKLARMIRCKYSIAAEKLGQRADHYNKGVFLAQQYSSEGKVLIVAPNDTCGVDTLSRDAEALNRLYGKGYKDGKQISDFLK